MSAHLINLLQTCPRRALLDSNWVTRLQPRPLFDEALQLGVLELVAGKSAEQAALVAVTHFQTFAASPGLACVGDPYVLAMDYCASLQTTLEALSRTAIPNVSLVGASKDWKFLSLMAVQVDKVLHRWLSIKSFSADDLSALFHSWHVAGDMAMLDAPMVLHLVELPSSRRGQIHSPWCRAFEHSHIRNRIQFQSKTGKPLVGDWKPFWLAKQFTWSIKEWVDLMLKENLKPWRDITLKALSSKAAEEIRDQIDSEGSRFRSLPRWQAIPMHRKACDFPEPCPFQDVCYGQKNPGECGFVPR